MEIPLESFENPLENLRRAFNEERVSSILPRRKRSPMHQKRKGFPIPAKVESLPLHQGEDKLTHPSKKEELTNALERKSPPIPPRRESHPVHPGADKPTKVQQEGRSLPMR